MAPLVLHHWSLEFERSKTKVKLMDAKMPTGWNELDAGGGGQCSSFRSSSESGYCALHSTVLLRDAMHKRDSFRQPHHSCLESGFISWSTCQMSTHLSIIPALIIHHFFTLSLQAQNLPFQQILPTFIDFFYLLDCLMIMGLDRTDHAHHFIISFTL